MATSFSTSGTAPRDAAPLDRAALRAWYLRNRNRTAELFSVFVPEAWLDRPIPLRHPLAFYEGHLPAFSYNKLIREALGGPSLDPAFEVLFERGIDPGTTTDAARHERAAWPDRPAVRDYGARVDRAILAAIESAPLEDATRSPLLAGGEAVLTILEHEELHHETFAYLLQRLPVDRKRGFGGACEDGPVPARRRVAIPDGTATLGAPRGSAYGWDNEFDSYAVDVSAFEIDVDDVTNADYLAFVRDGGPVPPNWIARDGGFVLRTMFDEIPLPPAWPVYVSNDAARSYAAWSGSDLMTEPEFHRAAFGTPDGRERALPWGDERPEAGHAFGNFDFRRYDPEPVGRSPLGTSAFGVNDLIGNGWEWTKTPFAGHPGFSPMPSYPQYSADFFDGKHYVMKGASPVTSRTQVRRSFRNWFYGDYPYAFTTFRTVLR